MSWLVFAISQSNVRFCGTWLITVSPRLWSCKQIHYPGLVPSQWKRSIVFSRCVFAAYSSQPVVTWSWPIFPAWSCWTSYMYPRALINHLFSPSKLLNSCVFPSFLVPSNFSWGQTCFTFELFFSQACTLAKNNQTR